MHPADGTGFDTQPAAFTFFAMHLNPTAILFFFAVIWHIDMRLPRSMETERLTWATRVPSFRPRAQIAAAVFGNNAGVFAGECGSGNSGENVAAQKAAMSCGKWLSVRGQLILGLTPQALRRHALRALEARQPTESYSRADECGRWTLRLRSTWPQFCRHGRARCAARAVSPGRSRPSWW